MVAVSIVSRCVRIESGCSSPSLRCLRRIAEREGRHAMHWSTKNFMITGAVWHRHIDVPVTSGIALCHPRQVWDKCGISLALQDPWGLSMVLVQRHRKLDQVAPLHFQKFAKLGGLMTLKSQFVAHRCVCSPSQHVTSTALEANPICFYFWDLKVFSKRWPVLEFELFRGCSLTCCFI